MAPTLNFSNVEQLYGDKWYFYHRVDMHKHLREMAEAARAVIRLGQRVDDVEIETGIIHLKDGSTVQKDLVIVADGQHVSISHIFFHDLELQLILLSGPDQRQSYRCRDPNEEEWTDRLSLLDSHEGYSG
jgi:hypothetical protein